MVACVRQSEALIEEQQSRARNGRHGRRGGALVEFVIVLPVLMMLVFGVWEFGRIFDAWLISTNAAREGARYAVAGDSDPMARVSNYLIDSYGRRLKSVNGVAKYAGGDVACVITIPPYSVNEPVQVEVTADVDIWAHAVAPLIGTSTFRVAAWSRMRQ